MTKRQQAARDEVVRRFVNKQRKRQAVEAGHDEFDAIPPEGELAGYTADALAAIIDPKGSR